jgi:hypothetical protein
VQKLQQQAAGEGSNVGLLLLGCCPALEQQLFPRGGPLEQSLKDWQGVQRQMKAGLVGGGWVGGWVGRQAGGSAGCQLAAALQRCPGGSSTAAGRLPRLWPPPHSTPTLTPTPLTPHPPRPGPCRSPRWRRTCQTPQSSRRRASPPGRASRCPSCACCSPPRAPWRGTTRCRSCWRCSPSTLATLATWPSTTARWAEGGGACAAPGPPRHRHRAAPRPRPKGWRAGSATHAQ